MNYWRILKVTLPVWAVVSAFVYYQYGMLLFCAETSAFAACLMGALLSEYLMESLIRSKKCDLGPAFLLGGLPRTIIPLFFLVFSLKYYHNTLDKITQYAIIGSYFAYYPLVLSVSVRQAIRNAKTQNAFSGGKTIAPLSEEKTESAVIDE